MGRLIWHVTSSLDGFVAGPGHSMGWVGAHAAPSELATEVMNAAGALLVGRRTYEVEDRDRGGFYGGAWRGPVVVLTREPPAEAPDWMTGTFVRDGLEAGVAHAREAAAGRDVVVLGADVARQCLERGLLDELVVHVVPMLLGDGVRLFGGPGTGRFDLERMALEQGDGVTALRFRVRTREGGDARLPEDDVAGVATAVIERSRYMTLATADEEGRPWASPVWYAPAASDELFWMSRTEARHSRNIAVRPQIGIVVFDSHVLPGSARPVYMEAVAEEVEDPELERGLEVFSRRSTAQGLSPLAREDVVPPAPFRLYRARVSRHFVLGRIDVRVPLELGSPG